MVLYGYKLLNKYVNTVMYKYEHNDYFQVVVNNHCMNKMIIFKW